MLVLEAAMVMRTHWGRLDDRDRREMARIVKKSHGLPNNLSKTERAELARLVRRLDLITAGRKLLPFHGGVRPSRR
jgi:hypothetical protein